MFCQSDYVEKLSNIGSRQGLADRIEAMSVSVPLRK
jgi:hypothetical protein